MSTNSILRGVLNRHDADLQRISALPQVERTKALHAKNHLQSHDALAATRLTLDHYLDAGRLLRAASQGDQTASETLAIRMLASNEFCEKMLMCAADAPSVRNEHTRQLLRIALQRTKQPAAPAADNTTEPELLRLHAGAPCNVSALTVDDQFKFVETLDTDDDGNLQFGGFGRKTFDKRYDRHRTFFVIDHQTVIEDAANPYACAEHGTGAGNRTPKPHKVYSPTKWNPFYAQYLAQQDHTSPIGRRLDNLARHLITGGSVTVISHEITKHAQIVAHELARRAEKGVRRPKATRREPVASHHNAPYTSMQWLNDEPDTSMFANPELDWRRWYWIPVQGGRRHVIAYLLPELRPFIPLRLDTDGNPLPYEYQEKPTAQTFLWQEGGEWRLTTLDNAHGNEGPRFLPKVFRHRLWEKTELVTRTVIDQTTGHLVDIETEEHRSAILSWNDAHAPHWLHRKLATAFRAGIHWYWLKHPSQAVWRLDWPGKEEAIEKLAAFNGRTRRTPIRLGLTVPVTENAIQDYRGVLPMYIPLHRRRVVSEHPIQRPTIYHEDDASDWVERGRLDPHDQQLREMTEAEFTDAVFAIEGGDRDSVSWLRDGDITASLAAQLGKDAGQYVAGLSLRQRGDDGETQPIVYTTHRQRYGANAEQQIDRILGKTLEERQAKELSKQQAESALLLLAVQEGRLTARDLADIAHRKGYRDCRITTPSGTVKMWAAASQLLQRKPVYVLLDGKPLTDEQKRRLNGPRIYVEYPVLPEPAAPTARTPDFCDRFRRQVQEKRQQQRLRTAAVRIILASKRRTYLPDAPQTCWDELRQVRRHGQPLTTVGNLVSLSPTAAQGLDLIEQTITDALTVERPASPLSPLAPGKIAYLP